MAGTMSQADLVAGLKVMLGDAASSFTGTGDSDFERHLDVAALDMGRVRPRTLVGELTLVADQPNYSVPAELLQPKYTLWGRTERRNRKPWNNNWPAKAPRMSVVENSGSRELWLDPAPTEAQITDLGKSFKYFYFAGHTIDADAANTTIPATDRELLLIRASAQALQELANHGVVKPVSIGDGFGSTPKNGTPAALAESVMTLFERMAA